MATPSRRAKIVATLGPASSDADTIENLIKAGVNVFRFNFSHGTKEDHEKRFKAVQEASKKTGKTVAILQDLQGPKLRVGVFKDGQIHLEKGEEVVLKLEDKNQTALKQKLISYNYKQLSKEIKPRHRILLDDGNLELVVTDIAGDTILTQVVFGGTLKDKKGMNFPDTKIGIEAFTPKDKADLLIGLELGVDYVALSFVRSRADILNIKKVMHAHGKNVPIIAKIEKAEAIENLIDILECTDAVMVARGDLAVEVGIALVPSLQKRIIYECRKRGIPVITATQMLESMIYSPRPTRAEASDVANAILDGTDAVMLSAESASGKFPVLAVSTMHGIILETELRAIKEVSRVKPLAGIEDGQIPIVEAVEHAAEKIAAWIGAQAIVCTTHTGNAARALARHRPSVPVIAYTDEARVQRQLALVWGIESAAMKGGETLDLMIKHAEEDLVCKKLVNKGDLVVFTGGLPPLKYGTTNFLKVITVQKEFNPISKNGDDALGYRTRRAQFVIDFALCIQCGGCVEVCPNDIFGMLNRKVYLKESNCKNCTFDNACMEICPTNAVEVIRLDD